MSRIEELTREIANGNLEALSELQALTMEINRRKECLAMHKTPITQTKSGRWRTRIGDKQIFKTRLSDLEDVIVEYYSEQMTRKTFPEAFNEWIAEKEEFEEIRKSSITRYRNDFKRFFPEDDPFCRIVLKDVSSSELERYIKRTIKRCELTRKTYGGLVIIIRGVLRYAKREEWTDFSVSTFFDDLMLSDSIFVKQPPKGDEEEVFSPDETALLINYFNEHPSVVHFGLHLMLLSGLRIGELCALRRNCVNLKSVSLEVMASEIQYDDKDGHRVFEVEETPKTDESRRTVYLPDSAATLLRKIQHMSPFGEWLFSYEDGRRVKSRAFNRALEVACEKVGIPVRSSHKIRKTYASTLIDAGVSTKLIQKQMGHKDFQTTKKYYDRDRTGEDYKRNEINRAVSL